MGVIDDQIIGKSDQKGGKRMDQIKIGKFIADERKRKGYTQKQLSEK